MSESPANRPGPGDEEQPPTPFDHPLFLPVLLFAGMIWFGYDGWLNNDPKMLEHQTFNRVGFGILTPLTAWFGYRGIREFRARRTEGRPGTPSPPPGS